MTPSVDWVRFLALMEGQCEPGFSSYEISKKRVRLANIDPELWFEEGVTRVFTAPVNIIEGGEVTGTVTRTVTTPYTHEEAARAMSDWRVTQQESVLRFPCHPSDVKRWAEAQFLEIGQELEDACNDEILERLAEETAPSQLVSGEDTEAFKKQHLQEQAILNEIKRQGLDPMALRFHPGKSGDKKSIAEVLLQNTWLFTDSSFGKAWDRLSSQGKIKNSRA